MINSIFNKHLHKGWYIAEICEGIEGNDHRIDFPLRIESKIGNHEKEFKSYNIILFFENWQEDATENISYLLTIIGKQSIYFKEKNISPFNQRNIDYMKMHCPGLSILIHVAIDVSGFNVIDALANVEMSAYCSLSDLNKLFLKEAS